MDAGGSPTSPAVPGVPGVPDVPDVTVDLGDEVAEGQVIADSEHKVRAYFEEHGYELIEKYRPFDSVNRYFKRKGP